MFRTRRGICARLQKRQCRLQLTKFKKANGTLRASQAVPHPSTDRALCCLTSEFRWDRVHSTQYGRWRKYRSTGRMVGRLNGTPKRRTDKVPQRGFEPPRYKKTGCDWRIALVCTLSQNGYGNSWGARTVTSCFTRVAGAWTCL